MSHWNYVWIAVALSLTHYLSRFHTLAISFCRVLCLTYYFSIYCFLSFFIYFAFFPLIFCTFISFMKSIVKKITKLVLVKFFLSLCVSLVELLFVESMEPKTKKPNCKELSSNRMISYEWTNKESHVLHVLLDSHIDNNFRPFHWQKFIR